MQPINTIERLLPTIGNVGGSIIGGLLGTAGGTAAGAAIPGADLTGASEAAGGVAGERIGQTAGGGVGQAAGKAFEDFLTHQKATLGQIVGNAAIGAGSSLAGGVLGGLVGKGADALLSGGKDATTGITSKVGGMMKGAANTLMQKNLMQADDPASLAQHFVEHGVTNPKQVATITDQLSTGANAKTPGIFTNMTQSALNQQTEDGRMVDLSAAKNNADGLLRGNTQNPAGNMLTKPMATRASNTIDDIFKSGLQDTPTNAPNYSATPSGAYKVYQQLRDTAYNMGAQKPGTPGAALQNTYKALAGSTKDAIFGKNGELVPLTDEEKGLLGQQIDKSIAPINLKTAAALKADISGASTHLDLNNMQTNWIDGKNAVAQGAKIASKNGGNDVAGLIGKVAPIAGLVTAGPLGGVVGATAAAGTTDAGHALATKVLSNVGDKLTGGVPAATEKTVGKIAPLLSRIGAIGGSIAGGLTQAGAPSAPAVPGVPGIPGNTATMAPGGAMQPTNVLQQAYDQQLQEQIRFANIAAATPAYLASADTGAVSSLGNTLAGMAPQLQKYNLAAGAADQANTAYNNAGGSGAGGILNQIQALIPGSAAQAYQRQAAAAASVISQQLGIPVSEAQGVLPTLLQSGGVAQQQQGALQSILQSLQPSTPALPAQ